MPGYKMLQLNGLPQFQCCQVLGFIMKLIIFDVELQALASEIMGLWSTFMQLFLKVIL